MAPASTSLWTRGEKPLLLYSTNTYLKFRLQEDYRGVHHVWCSPIFSASTRGRYELGAGQPPTSDPASIYRDLYQAVAKTDEHCDKIASQKKTLLALAELWCTDKHMAAIVSKARFPEWRPLLFVIPYSRVEARIKEVERDRRASSEPEYIIEDLIRGEFDILELTP